MRIGNRKKNGTKNIDKGTENIVWKVQQFFSLAIVHFVVASRLNMLSVTTSLF